MSKLDTDLPTGVLKGAILALVVTYLYWSYVVPGKNGERLLKWLNFNIKQ
jgi:hypothetical protein